MFPGRAGCAHWKASEADAQPQVRKPGAGQGNDTSRSISGRPAAPAFTKRLRADNKMTYTHATPLTCIFCTKCVGTLNWGILLRRWSGHPRSAVS